MPFEDVKLTSCNENAELILEMEILSAGQCAIIAVDEILEATKTRKIKIKPNTIDFVWAYDKDWQEVKKELTI